jgi:hypothetical protein
MKTKKLAGIVIERITGYFACSYFCADKRVHPGVHKLPERYKRRPASHLRRGQEQYV